MVMLPCGPSVTQAGRVRLGEGGVEVVFAMDHAVVAVAGGIDDGDLPPRFKPRAECFIATKDVPERPADDVILSCAASEARVSLHLVFAFPLHAPPPRVSPAAHS